MEALNVSEDLNLHTVQQHLNTLYIGTVHDAYFNEIREILSSFQELILQMQLK